MKRIRNSFAHEGALSEPEVGIGRSSNRQYGLSYLILAAALLSLIGCSSKSDDSNRSEEGTSVKTQTSAAEAQTSAAETQASAAESELDICEKIAGTWSGNVNADTGWLFGKGKVLKNLIIENRSVKIMSLDGNGQPYDTGWMGWNTSRPESDGNSCVFSVRESIEGEGFYCENPYSLVTEIRAEMDGEGLDLRIEYGDVSAMKCGLSGKRCDKSINCTKGGKPTSETIARVQGWFNSLDGSFWTRVGEPAKNVQNDSNRGGGSSAGSAAARNLNDDGACLMKCSGEQNACVIQCNGRESCITSCAADGQRCLGRCL